MNFTKLLLITSLFLSTACYSKCDTQNDNQIYAPLKLSDTRYIVFRKSILPEAFSPEHEYQISLGVFNCTTNQFEEFGKLPYLATPGKVEAAFLARAKPDNEEQFFVVHSAEVGNAATGVNYATDYYNARVYNSNNGIFTADNTLNEFFGAGGDIFEEDFDNIVYKYPYKDEASISKIISTEDYKALLQGKTLTKSIARKAYLHDEPLESEKTSKYLIKDDPVRLYSQTSGWCLVGYNNPRHGEIKGWVNCEYISDLFTQN
ncbi:hypothetical protein QE250_00145 [Chromatiaceae bacterium AAb-1]|nr:hypothetical protein [Chromatiaceae bacterium AAb-1]